MKDIEKVKQDAFDRIRAVLKTLNTEVLNAIDIDEGSSPVIKEDPYDGNMTFTLDSIDISDDGRLSFDASNCCENISLGENAISVEEACGIAAWLENHLADMVENLIQDNCDDIDIDDVEGMLEKLGATDIEYGDEDIDDGLDDDEDGDGDRYLMRRSYDFRFGRVSVHGRFYFGDASRTVSCMTLDCEFEPERDETFCVRLNSEQLQLISDICHDYKDGHRGDADVIRPVMALEKTIAEQTHGLYMSDPAYDVKSVKTKIVTWPFVQDLFDVPGFRDNSALCSSHDLYEAYGDSAYAVSEDWLNTLTDKRALKAVANCPLEDGPEVDFDELDDEDDVKTI